MKKLLNLPCMFALGLAIGVIARLLDIYTYLLGTIFSEMAIWILLGTLIAIYSDTPKKAALNELAFCLGMLITYYVTAEITDGVYGKEYIIGWTEFALVSAPLAYITWYTKQRGRLPKLISLGIVAVSALSSPVLFRSFHAYDIIINAVLAYILFFRKVKREQGGTQ